MPHSRRVMLTLGGSAPSSVVLTPSIDIAPLKDMSNSGISSVGSYPGDKYTLFLFKSEGKSGDVRLRFCYAIGVEAVAVDTDDLDDIDFFFRFYSFINICTHNSCDHNKDQ